MLLVQRVYCLSQPPLMPVLQPPMMGVASIHDACHSHPWCLSQPPMMPVTAICEICNAAQGSQPPVMPVTSIPMMPITATCHAFRSHPWCLSQPLIMPVTATYEACHSHLWCLSQPHVMSATVTHDACRIHAWCLIQPPVLAVAAVHTHNPVTSIHDDVTKSIADFPNYWWCLLHPFIVHVTNTRDDFRSHPWSLLATCPQYTCLSQCWLP